MARPPAFQAKAIQSLKEGIEKEQYTVRMLQAPNQKMCPSDGFLVDGRQVFQKFMMVFLNRIMGRKPKNGVLGGILTKRKIGRVVE